MAHDFLTQSEAGFGTRAPRRVVPWALAAAAVLLALVTLVVSNPGEDDRPWHSGTLSGETLRKSEPQGEVSSLTHFFVSMDVPQGGYFVIEVHDAETPRGSPPVLENRSLRSSRWELSQEQVRRLPSHLRWTVEVYDVWNELQGIGEFLAEF